MRIESTDKFSFGSFSSLSLSLGIPLANVKSTKHSNVTGERAESNGITDLSRCSDLLLLPVISRLPLVRRLSPFLLGLPIPS